MLILGPYGVRRDQAANAVRRGGCRAAAPQVDAYHGAARRLVVDLEPADGPELLNLRYTTNDVEEGRSGVGDGRLGSIRPAARAITALVLLVGCRGTETARESQATAVEQASPTWRALPTAPIAGRVAAGSVWTGREMIVWGGVAGTEKARPSDGAAHDPVAGTWRSIAPAPAGVLGEAHLGAVWTGDEAMFWAGNSPDGPAAGAVYNPGTNTWRRLAEGPLGIRDGHISVWTGSEMIIMGGHGGRSYSTPVAAAVNPRSGAWRPLPAFDDLFGLGLSGAVWDGDEVLAVGSLSTSCPALGARCAESRPIFLGFNPATNVRRDISLVDAPFDATVPPSLIGWTGAEAAFARYHGSSVAVVRYDPRSQKWRTGPESPCPLGSAYVQVAWLGDRYVAGCGDDRLQLYDLAANTWTTVAAGPSPLNSRAGSMIVWTGTTLIAWSGTIASSGNPTPSDGASISLRR